MFALNRFFEKRHAEIIISESELFQFFEIGSTTTDEIVGSLIGFDLGNHYRVLNIFKCSPTSASHIHIKYNSFSDLFLPAGLINLGTIHTHPQMGAFLSSDDMIDLKEKYKISVVLDPFNLEIKGFNKEGCEIDISVVDDLEIPLQIFSYYSNNIPFSVYTTDLSEYCRIKIKEHIDKRYNSSQIFGFNDFLTEESRIFFDTPKVIFLKYRKKVPLHFFVKGNLTYGEWFEEVVQGGILDFTHRFAYISINGNLSEPVRNYIDEEVRNGTTKILLY